MGSITYCDWCKLKGYEETIRTFEGNFGKADKVCKKCFNKYKEFRKEMTSDVKVELCYK